MGNYRNTAHPDRRYKEEIIMKMSYTLDYINSDKVRQDDIRKLVGIK